MRRPTPLSRREGDGVEGGFDVEVNAQRLLLPGRRLSHRAQL